MHYFRLRWNVGFLDYYHTPHIITGRFVPNVLNSSPGTYLRLDVLVGNLILQYINIFF